jgi:F-type H+-transporting ATPase subunit b
MTAATLARSAARVGRRSRRIFAPGAALFMATAWALPALASEDLVLIPDYAFFGLIAGEQGIGMLWVMVALFVVLIFPLNTLMFKPIFSALDARSERIAGARERSQQLETEADTVLTRYETAIRDARAEAESTRQAQLGEAREEQATLTASARADAETDLAKARSELGRSLEEARASLRASADELATTAAEQVLGRSLS